MMMNSFGDGPGAAKQHEANVFPWQQTQTLA
jgi:hypothetical protein